MKKLIFLPFILLWIIPAFSQVKKPGIPSQSSAENNSVQNTGIMAILKTSSRLFAEKDDLTSVILVIPSGDTVSVVTADSTYLKVVYRGTDGYVLSKHAVVKTPPRAPSVNTPAASGATPKAPVKDNQMTRYENLIYKYGKSLADKLIAGKIWKGMDSEMVKDSWGNAIRINRVISGSLVTEEWIYRNTWLYFENSVLYDWGPARK
jgi:hypothetical protein